MGDEKNPEILADNHHMGVTMDQSGILCAERSRILGEISWRILGSIFDRFVLKKSADFGGKKMGRVAGVCKSFFGVI
jgi:hypothetical protein